MVGLLPTLHSDNNKNFKKGLFKRLLQNFGIIPTYTEPHLPCHNRSEPVIGEVNLHARNLMLESNTPIRFCGFCYKYNVDILSLCVTVCFELLVRTPYETVMNYTYDIYEYASFSWFQWSWFYDENLKSKQLRL